jgi:hypothetical protein
MGREILLGFVLTGKMAKNSAKTKPAPAGAGFVCWNS